MIPFFAAIHITVNGYAKIRWIKKGYPSDSERATCRAYRSYLSSRSYVLGSVTGSSSIIDWLAGEYTYSFHVILPDNLPTSFDGKYGQIHYEIIATIDRPSRYPKVYRLPFTVIRPLDLNFDPIYRVSKFVLNVDARIKTITRTGPIRHLRPKDLLEFLLPNWTINCQVLNPILWICCWAKDQFHTIYK